MARAVTLAHPVPAAAAEVAAGRRALLEAWALLAPLVLFLLLLFVVPFAYSIWVSLVPPQAGPGLTLAAYRKFLADSFYLRIGLNTLILGAAVTGISLVLGYPMAYVLARTRSRWKELMLFLIIAPLMVSIIMRTFGWLVILGRKGLVNAVLAAWGLTDRPVLLLFNWTGVLIGLVHVLLPFMILSIASVLEKLDESLEDAALVLGASRWQAFRMVVLPLSIEGIAAGCILVSTLTIGSFVTVLLMGGPGTVVMPLLIYQQVTVVFERHFAGAIGTLLLILSFAAVYAQTRFLKREAL